VRGVRAGAALDLLGEGETVTVMGVDLGIHKIAVALFSQTALVHAQGFTSDSTLRDVQLHELGMVAQGLAMSHQADSIWIEDTLVGNNRKYSMQLAEAKGAVLSALSHLRGGQGTDIRLVNVGTWKKQVCGNGHASKEQVRNYITESHPSYAPLCEGDQDLYDAACIGLYGLQILARAEHLRL
jgi:Holliday junction resolvasome RuvABC endonuclease subunit